MSSEGTWYYAQNNNKYGPINSAQLKALVENGQLQKTDLVWKEGMDDWKPAGKVAGLFAAETVAPVAASSPAPPAVDPQPDPVTGTVGVVSEKRTTRVTSRGNPFDFMEALKPFGSIVLLAGLVIVLFSRGCDSINIRDINAAAANVEALRIEEPGDDETADDRKKKQDKIKSASKSVENKRINTRRMGKWLEVLFVLGTVCLSTGLLITGLTAEGAGRWIAMVMLAIIVFSVYIGGTAWMASIQSLLPAVGGF